MLRMTDPHTGQRRFISWDIMVLIAEMSCHRLPLVAGKAVKKNNGVAPFSAQELEDLKSLRRIHKRLERGDYRLTVDELALIADVANWLIQLHAKNEGHPSKKPFEIVGNPWRSTSIPPGSYQEVMEQVRSGALRER